MSAKINRGEGHFIKGVSHKQRNKAKRRADKVSLKNIPLQEELDEIDLAEIAATRQWENELLRELQEDYEREFQLDAMQSALDFENEYWQWVDSVESEWNED